MISNVLDEDCEEGGKVHGLRENMKLI